MTEPDCEEPRPVLDRRGTEVRQPATDPQSVPEDAVTLADQAVSNQEQALESGEENVV